MKKWYHSHGTEGDIVLSTRVRIARNLERFPFEPKMLPQQHGELAELVCGALSNIRLGENTFRFYAGGEIDSTQMLALLERHIVSPAFVKRAENASLLLSEDESLSVMIGEEDHIRIQVLQSGLAFETALDLANRLDDVLDETLDYAFDEELGYLTTCPTNLGTGLRASVMLHLPALERAGMIAGLGKTISKLGLTIRGTFGEGSKARGALYQVSNQITLGLPEQSAVRNLESIVRQIIAQERELRTRLLEENPEVGDRIWRAYGILKYARILSVDELCELLSHIRVGISAGMFPAIPAEKVNALEFEAGTAGVMQSAGGTIPPQERDKRRANLVREEI